ncbi:MAG: sulfotransferase [Rhizobiales bacterium]|nr:sulfotransferase [Hyphomicrobiales bacterium]
MNGPSDIAGGAEPSTRPFRLIVHIGAGKTGTSSIQKTLFFGSSKLRKGKTLYLGLNLEHAPDPRFSWQRPDGSEEFHALGAEQGKIELFDCLQNAIRSCVEAGYSQAVWSNESLLDRKNATAACLTELAADGVTILIVAYIRRYDAWARSSYIQWGIKHKTYHGPLLGYAEFRKKRPVLFGKHLADWYDAFGERLIIRNLDEVGDVVDDFFAVTGLSIDGIEKQRFNDTPTGEELALRAMFNTGIEEKALPEVFDGAMQVPDLRFDLTPTQWLSALLPDEDDLKAVADASETDRLMLDVLLRACGAAPVETSPLETKAPTVDTAKLLTAVSQIVMKQSLRIKRLEERLAEGGARPALDSRITGNTTGTDSLTRDRYERPTRGAPVFVISRCQPACAMMQRLLNCHLDIAISGAHDGILNGFVSPYQRMSNQKLNRTPGTVPDGQGRQLAPVLHNPEATAGRGTPQSLPELSDQIRAFVDDYFCKRLEPGMRWGFAESSYNNTPTLRMIRELYPRGRFVFVRRETTEVVRSKVEALRRDQHWSSMTREERQRLVYRLFKEARDHSQVHENFLGRFPHLGVAVELNSVIDKPQEALTDLLTHLNLNPGRYNWPMANAVLSSGVGDAEGDVDIEQLINDAKLTMAAET